MVKDRNSEKRTRVGPGLVSLLVVLNSEPEVVTRLADGSGPPHLTQADIEEWRQLTLTNTC